MALQNIFSTSSPSDEDHWVSVSDLMAGLMVIFLFIAITYIRPLQSENESVRDIAVAFDETEKKIYEALRHEFKGDLAKWEAELDRRTLSIRFWAPEILFDTAQVTLKENFKVILADFFPRYIKVLQNFKNKIEEIRIEGHTSSEWASTNNPVEAYFKNMELSQGRTRKVLAFSLTLPNIGSNKKWIVEKLTANGLSSSQLVLVDGQENKALSRRVEFRVRSDAKTQMVKILGAAR